MKNSELINVMRKEYFDLLYNTCARSKLELLDELILQENNPKIKSLLDTAIRDSVEEDANFKQVIPYVVIIDRKMNILTYTRKGSESRLRGQRSIGFGGHWKAEESFMDCIRRELREELNMTEFYSIFFEAEDLIYSEANPVDAVHLGVLVTAIVYDATAIGNLENNEVKNIEVCNINSIDVDFLEEWSKIAYEKIFTTIKLTGHL
ncbi:MAG: NUDIX domain-containing protein [Clostridia bacterium]